MLFTTLSSWAYLEKRKLFEVFPEPVQKLWNTWELRVMVLISLALQTLLFHFGSRRKYNVKTKIRVLLWFAYLMADWVATVALGVISQNQGKSCSCDANKTINDSSSSANEELSAFWAPFLLLHLGGPDTITAYALEDNELWLRHLLGLIVQAGVALYIFLMAWKTSWLSVLTIPMLLAGLIKYGERTLALRSANREKFRDSILTRPDPGPNYAKFMEELTLRQAEGYQVQAEDVGEVQAPNDHSYIVDGTGLANDNIELKTYELFQIFKRLFVDLILSFEDRDSSQMFFQQNVGSSEKAFEVVETELGYAYDVFYTKAPIIYTGWGCVFRTITFFFTCLVFVLFLVNVRHGHSPIDLIITYILLGGAILLEIYAMFWLVSSEWATLWLKARHGKTYVIEPLIRGVKRANKQMWSNSMAQFNLLSFCLKVKSAVRHEKPQSIWIMQKVLEMQWCKSIQKFSTCMKYWLFSHILRKFDEKLGIFSYLTYTPISDELKSLIWKQVSHRTDHPTDLCTAGGNLVLKKYDFPNFMDYITDVEFDQSILLWHIATDLCYQHDVAEKRTLCSDCEVSKNIADYMMYLLVMCPFMLPVGIGLIRFQDTCAEAKEFFEERNLMGSAKDEACGVLLRVNTEVMPAKVKGDRSKSVLFEAHILASKLNAKEEHKWEILSQVWIEILGYAASHCRGITMRSSSEEVESFLLMSGS